MQPQLIRLQPILPDKLKANLIEPFSSQWALKFNGNNTYVSIPDSSNLFINTPITYGCWFKQNGTQDINATLMWKGGSTGTLQRILFFFDGSSTTDVFGRMRIGSITHTIGPGTFAVNKWHQIIITYDRSDMILYGDGIEVDRLSLTDNIDSGNGTDLQFGGFGANNSFSGQLRNCFVSHRAWSSDEILRTYENPQLPPDTRDLVGLWRLQEGYGINTPIRNWSDQNSFGSMQNFSGNPWVNVGIR